MTPVIPKRPAFPAARRGEGMLAFLIVFLPVAVILLSMAVDGMGAAAAYRRALTLAAIGAQAGGAALRFSGGAVGAGAAGGGEAACAAALQSVCENTGGCNPDTVQVSCLPTAEGVRLTVRLRPVRIVYGPLSMGPDWVSAVASSSAASGIEYQD